MSTHTMELEAYTAYERFCARVGVQPMDLDNWRKASDAVPMRSASPYMHGYTSNPGFSIFNPQTRIMVRE